MKQLFTLLFLSVISATSVFAQQKDGMSAHHVPEPRESPKMVADGEYATVTYGQPSKKGRIIFGGLESYGKVWRTGANEATQITFKRDVMFSGEKVKKGTYTLFTIPNPEHWTIILNEQLNQWGAFEYEKYKSKNVVMTTVPVKPLTDVVEKLDIEVKNGGLYIAWDKTSVMIPIK